MAITEDKTSKAKDDSLDDLTQVKALVDWKNPPKLADLKSDCEAAATVTKQHFNKVTEWLDAFNGTGKYAPPDIAGRSKMLVKLVRKQVEWRCPSLTEPFLSNSKLFEVGARTSEDMASASQHELILNYQFKTKINSVKLMDELVRQLCTEGTGILKVYWDYKADVTTTTKTNYAPQPMQDQQQIQLLQQQAQQLQQDPGFIRTLEEPQQYALQYFMGTGQPVEFIPVSQEEVEEARVITNQPNAEVCNIEDVYVDPSCKGNFDKAKFAVHKFNSCLADLREDGRYSNLDDLSEEIETYETSAINKDSSGFQFKDKDRKIIEVFEYWGYYNIDNDGILHSIVASWVGDTLIRLERNPYPDNKIPFVFIPMIPVRGSIYGEPDAELIKENQKIMSATVRGMVDLFGRSANGQTGFSKGFLDPANLTKFNRGENYNFNGNMDPARGIFTHKFNEIPQSAFAMLNYMSGEAEAFSGVKPFNQGVNETSVNRTMGSSRSPLDATAIRDSSILRRIAQGIVQMAYKFQTLNSELLDENDVIRITNSKFVPVDPNNLNGDFDLKIDISTPESDQAKAADLAFLLQTGQNNFPFEFTQRILAQIAKLKNQPDLEQFITDYQQPPPDPIAQQKAQLEIQEMQANINFINAQAAEAWAKSKVSGAEVNVRDARADNIQSNTDKNNISTYKTANGIDQAEKLELTKAQQQSKLEADQIKANQQANLQAQAKNQDHNLHLLKQGASNDLEAYSDPNNQQASNPNSQGSAPSPKPTSTN
jgi:hypothetical protein